MKTNALTPATSQHDPVLEKLIQTRDRELKEQAQKNAKHLATRNLPGKEDSDLSPYIGDLKTGYEALATDILSRLQPHTHYPEAKMDADYLREKDRLLENEIRKKEDSIRNELFELGDYNPKTIARRIRIVLVISIILALGEVVFNSKVFQITGENLLFALIISVSITVGVNLFAHLSVLQYKAAKTKLKRRLIVAASLTLATGVFIALALLRTRYLAAHHVDVSPINFVVFNLFYFIVTSLLSFYVFPTKEEIKLNHEKIVRLQAIEKMKKEAVALKGEREHLKEVILENTKHRIRISYYAHYLAERIRKKYHESVELFKSTNIIFRTDKFVPECFSHPAIEPNIESHTLNFIHTTDK